MTVFSLVASHHDLDLDTVARLSAGATGVGPALPGSGAAGAVVLATCNRVEIYAEADGAGVEAARTGLLSAVAASTSLPDEDVHTAFRTLDALTPRPVTSSRSAPDWTPPWWASARSPVRSGAP